MVPLLMRGLDLDFYFMKHLNKGIEELSTLYISSSLRLTHEKKTKISILSNYYINQEYDNCYPFI